MSDHDIDRITHLNAMRHFSYDPFTVLGGRENCTVGALRERAIGHDIAIKAQSKGPIEHSRTAAADLMKMASSKA